jgi:hypothetical protein
VHLGVYYRSSSRDEGGTKRIFPRSNKTQSNQPSRDLRSVMKVAVKGNSCRPPEKMGGVTKRQHSVGTQVVDVQPGLIECSGLLRCGYKLDTFVFLESGHCMGKYLGG